MNKPIIILFASLLLASKVACSQTFEFTRIVTTDSVSKSMLFQRATEWVVEGFKSAKDVTQSSDKKNGAIIGKATLRLNLPAVDWVTFTFSITVKGGKYKYVFRDFYHEGYTSGGERNGGNLDNAKPACGGFRMTGRYWQKIKERTTRQAEIMITSLEQKMKEKSLSEEF